jgi:hypothetical protein
VKIGDPQFLQHSISSILIHHSTEKFPDLAYCRGVVTTGGIEPPPGTNRGCHLRRHYGSPTDLVGLATFAMSRHNRPDGRAVLPRTVGACWAMWVRSSDTATLARLTAYAVPVKLLIYVMAAAPCTRVRGPSLRASRLTAYLPVTSRARFLASSASPFFCTSTTNQILRAFDRI